MAKFPQIPAPEFGKRPEGSAAPAAMLDAHAIEAPFADAAKGMGEAGDALERVQEQRDRAREKLQKVNDAITATRMAGDHAEAARGLLNQLQSQHFADPKALPAEKVPEEFRRQLREMTESEISAAPNANVALDVAEKYAKIDDQQHLSAQGWMFLRTAQQTKDGVYKLGQSQVRAAQAQTTVAGLGAAISDARGTLAPLLPQTHGANADKAWQDTAHSMAASWVEANGPNDPSGVRAAVDAAVKTKSGPLYDNLPAKELAEYQRRLDKWSKGYGERQRGQVAAEAIDSNTKLLDLFHSKELDTKNIYQLRDELQRKQFAIKANPQYKDNPEEKVQQSEIVQTQINTLDALAHAGQDGGHWSEKSDDPKKTAALSKRIESLSKSESRSPADLLKVLQVQRDLAEAQRDHWISPGDAETMTRHLLLVTGKDLAKKNGSASSMGPLKSPITPNPVRQVGVSALDDLVRPGGAYGKLSAEQTTAMRMEYHRLANDAGESGRNLDEQAARKMAVLAVQHVLSRAKKAHEGK